MTKTENNATFNLMEENPRKHRQLTLDLSHRNLDMADVDYKVAYNKISTREATFKSGLTTPIHRWFRLTPSFGPDLVQEMLSSLKCSPDNVILDPFAGVGTTNIVAQKLGYESVGFDINPVAHFAGKVKSYYFSPTDQRKISKNIINFKPKKTEKIPNSTLLTRSFSQRILSFHPIPLFGVLFDFDRIL